MNEVLTHLDNLDREDKEKNTIVSEMMTEEGDIVGPFIHHGVDVAIGPTTDHDGCLVVIMFDCGRTGGSLGRRGATYYLKRPRPLAPVEIGEFKSTPAALVAAADMIVNW